MNIPSVQMLVPKRDLKAASSLNDDFAIRREILIHIEYAFKRNLISILDKVFETKLDHHHLTVSLILSPLRPTPPDQRLYVFKFNPTYSP